MARNYNVRTTCSATQSTTNAPLLIIATTAVVPNIYEINSGCVATPANQAVEWVVNRFTATGTLQGAITPSKVNVPAGTAVVAVTTAGTGSSALSTFTANDYAHGWAQNQNTAYRWVASSPGRMIGIASSAGVGVGLMPITATATVATWVLNVAFEE